MTLLHYVLVAVTLVLSAFYADANEVDRNCLGCLCEATTQCNSTTKCHVPYAGAYFCGPFHLSWAYWADADKPVLQHDDPQKPGAFENCAQDLYCAAKTVRQYMQKFGEKPEEGDCNGDGSVDCIDFAYMHRLGGYSCRDSSFVNTTFYKRFHNCWQVVQAALPNDASNSS